MSILLIIRAAPPHLIIAGGRRRGTMYGVYAFLEEHLGCRWFTPSVSHIPRRQRLELGAMDDRQTPALEYREVFYRKTTGPAAGASPRTALLLRRAMEARTPRPSSFLSIR